MSICQPSIPCRTITSSYCQKKKSFATWLETCKKYTLRSEKSNSSYMPVLHDLVTRDS